MHVAGVGGVETAEDEEYLARAVGGGVEKGSTCEREGVLERGVAFRFEGVGV